MSLSDLLSYYRNIISDEGINPNNAATNRFSAGGNVKELNIAFPLVRGSQVLDFDLELAASTADIQPALNDTLNSANDNRTGSGYVEKIWPLRFAPTLVQKSNKSNSAVSYQISTAHLFPDLQNFLQFSSEKKGWKMMASVDFKSYVAKIFDRHNLSHAQFVFGGSEIKSFIESDDPLAQKHKSNFIITMDDAMQGVKNPEIQVLNRSQIEDYSKVFGYDIKESNIHMIWRSFEHELVREKNTERIIMEMSELNADSLPSPELAKAYIDGFNQFADQGYLIGPADRDKLATAVFYMARAFVDDKDLAEIESMSLDSWLNVLGERGYQMGERDYNEFTYANMIHLSHYLNQVFDKDPYAFKSAVNDNLKLEHSRMLFSQDVLDFSDGFVNKGYDNVAEVNKLMLTDRPSVQEVAGLSRSSYNGDLLDTFAVGSKSANVVLRINIDDPKLVTPMETLLNGVGVQIN